MKFADPNDCGKRKRFSKTLHVGLGLLTCLVLPITGKAEVTELKVNTGPWETNQGASIAVLTDGRFVLGWHEYAPTRCFGRVFSPEGSPLGSQFDLHSPLSNWKYGPSLAPLPDGTFASFFGWSYGTRGQKVDESLNPVGTPVYFATPSITASPSIAALASGDIIVCAVSEPAPYPITCRRYDTNLVPYNSAWQANISSPGLIWGTSVAAAPNGNYTVQPF